MAPRARRVDVRPLRVGRRAVPILVQPGAATPTRREIADGPLLHEQLAVVAASCTFMDDADRTQCIRAEDCMGHGISSDAVCIANVCTVPGPPSPADAGDAAPVVEDPVWGCLGKLPPLPEPEPALDYYAGFQGLTGNRLVDLPARPCASDDPTCEKYDGPSFFTDDAGAVKVPLYSGFRGYLELTASERAPGLVTTLSYVLPVPDKARPPLHGPALIWILLTTNEMNFDRRERGQVRQSRSWNSHLRGEGLPWRARPECPRARRADRERLVHILHRRHRDSES